MSSVISSLLEVLSSVLGTFSSFAGCCIPNANLSINGRAYRVVKLLGEGGFSFVYLVQDGSGNFYALKKIRCTLGTEDAELAQREIDIYQLFNHKNIIRLIDSCTISEPDGNKTVYILLPYYSKGNLQDAINRNNLNQNHFPEQYLLKIFRDVCVAVREFHTYTANGGTKVLYDAQQAITPDEDHRPEEALLSNVHDQPTGDQLRVGENGEFVPWVHKDIKPGNVLLSDDGETPILMDFGSACPARVQINNRQEALHQQDLAAEHCTMPFRAPELFDVKVGTTLTEKVDIWSLGCTLFAMAYGQSPFEMNDQGGSVALAVLNNQFKIPDESLYSEDVKELIRWLLTTDPALRPDIHQVIDRLNDILSKVADT
ncbi:kinase-like domain-containing protein [Mycotypha africana]|uniref:kinase-like domain-containing protein n=1 Tax=Mycotypha africana TaxID=64632 RepID=UPI002301A1DD|nr:kinase-like domain-containing protein [Mycotypha africana]KAI8991894.1 kinase-like domain-containing protein [Mycotypha africana]